MYKKSTLIVIMGFTIIACSIQSIKYPSPRSMDHRDDYFGTTIADPYRWMEDIDSTETVAWVKQQQQLSAEYFSKLESTALLTNRINQLWNYEKYSVPFREGNKIFYSKNDGLQNQSVLYVQDNDQSEARVLLDPNTFSEDGTVALSGYSVNNAGEVIAYGISKSGSDWQEWKFRNIETGQDLPDHLQWIKFSSANWNKDGTGVYYSRYDAPTAGEVLEQANYNQKLFFHKIGTDQKDDLLIYQRPDHSDWGFYGDVSEDGRYLVITVSKGTDQRNRFFYKDLANAKNPVVELLNDFDAEYNFLGNINSVFYFKTDLEAPNGKIIAIDTNKPARSHWKTIIAESENPIRDADIVNNQFIVHRLKDVLGHVTIYDINGTQLTQVKLPGAGAIGGFNGKTKDTDTYFVFNSYIQAPTIYHYDLNTFKSTVFREPKIAFNPDDFVSEQVFYASKDGTKIPMMLSYKKGLKKNGRNPTLLYAYGGFSISVTPRFSSATIAWMEAGGIYAVPNLRGGAEYGEDWHQAGMFDKKQNVFDDFFAAAEFLIAKNYTSSQKLGVYGRSNGGLLIGAAVTQRPELFAATVPAVGVMDMLRFHKFTIGWAWASEYGSSDKPKQFKYLVRYSPLHNLQARDYPATLVMTADHDDRVVPSHSFKFAATMQAKQQGKAPIIARIESKAGHGAGKPTSMVIQEQAEIYAFLLENMKASLPDSFGTAN